MAVSSGARGGARGCLSGPHRPRPQTSSTANPHDLGLLEAFLFLFLKEKIFSQSIFARSLVFAITVGNSKTWAVLSVLSSSLSGPGHGVFTPLLSFTLLGLSLPSPATPWSYPQGRKGEGIEGKDRAHWGHWEPLTRGGEGRAGVLGWGLTLVVEVTRGLFWF